MTKAVTFWNKYWFRPTPLLHLAIARIVIVGFQLFYLVSSENIIPRLLERTQVPDRVYDPIPILRVLTLPFGWNFRPSLGFIAVVFSLTLVTGCLALVGIKTNFSLFFFAIGNIFIQAFLYSFGDHHHPEGIMMMALIFLAFSPSGGVLSIDDLGRKLKHRTEQSRFESFNIVDETSTFALWPLLLVQWMYTLIYLSAVVSKLGLLRGTFTLDWFNGYTLQYYLLNDGLHKGSAIGVWLGQQHVLAQLLAWLTIFFEGTFFLVLIFPKLSLLYVPMGLGLHGGIAIAKMARFYHFMVIYVVFIAWVPIIKFLSKYFGLHHERNKAEIFFDGNCLLCIRTMTILQYFDWFDRFNFRNLETEWSSLSEKYPHISVEECRQEMHVVMPNGSIYKGFFAFRQLFGYLPLLWPLKIMLHLPFASVLSPWLYRLIAGRRFGLENCGSGACTFHYQPR